MSHARVLIFVEEGFQPKNEFSPMTLIGEKTFRGNPLTGDYGGPLVCDINGILTLVGIASKGRYKLPKEDTCNKEGYPGIYTNIQAFRSWLDESKFT